jgi:hypothetical protein
MIGALAIAVLVATTIYVAINGWDDKALVIGGYVLASAALVVAVVPLFGRDSESGGKAGKAVRQDAKATGDATIYQAGRDIITERRERES